MLHESSRYGIQGTGEVDVLSTVDINVNGAVLQAVYEDGRRKARLSNATANSIFLGFSFGIVGSGVPATLPTAEVLKVPSAAPYSVQLASPLSAAGLLTVILGNGYGATPLTATANANTAPADATQYQLLTDNQTIVLAAANAGKDLFVVYRYSPTIEASRWIYGDRIPGNNSPQNFGRIGTIYNGIVVTDQFDTNANWAGAVDVSTGNLLRGGANGLVTLGGNGCLVNGHVVAIPTVDLPFLSIALDDQP